MRVDAHVHLSAWWPEIRRTGYRPDLEFTVAGLLREMDRSRLDYALAIQLVHAASELEALAEGRRVAEASGGRLLPVATVDPTRGERSVEATVAVLERDRSAVGIKLFPGYRPFYPHDRRLDPVYELARRRGLPVLVHQGDTLDGAGLLKYARPIEVDEVAGRFPELRLVLCHLGNPWIEEAAEIVYKNPNVYADTSGLLPPPSSPYFRRARELALRRVEEVVVSTGKPERFLYGSDWPLAEIRASVDLVERLKLEPGDVERILGENAAGLFRLKGAVAPRPEAERRRAAR